MGHQRDAAGPEARVLLGAGDLLGELGREAAPDGRDVDADLLEDPAVHDAHDPAAARAFVVGVAIPGLALEAAGRDVGEAGRVVAGQLVLQGLESRADVVTQRLEPGSGARLVVLDLDLLVCGLPGGGVHSGDS